MDKTPLPSKLILRGLGSTPLLQALLKRHWTYPGAVATIRRCGHVAGAIGKPTFCCAKVVRPQPFQKRPQKPGRTLLHCNCKVTSMLTRCQSSQSPKYSSKRTNIIITNLPGNLFNSCQIVLQHFLGFANSLLLQIL